MADDYKDHRAHGDEEYANLYRDPIDRYGQLPEGTRRWLENLREDDLKELDEERKFYRSVKTIARFNKYLVMLIVGIFVAAVQFGESISKFFVWLSHVGRS